MTEGQSGREVERGRPMVPPDDLAPGGPRAKARGCLCSVLANAAYRSGAAERPSVDPRCPMHADPAESA